MEKVNNMKEQMDNISKEMQILREKKPAGKSEECF